MMHDKLFNLDKREIEGIIEAHGHIHAVRKNITIIEKCSLSIHKNADLIIQYNKESRPDLIVERVWKEDCSFLRWFFLWVEGLLRGFTKSDDLDNSYCFNSEFVDIAVYKRVWFEWLKKLIGGDL